MLFDMGPFELLAIVVLAVMLFGPDKLPKLIQDVAAMLRKVREFSDSAKQDIRKELGPDFQDFEFEDLKPKNFVRKHVLNGDGADEYGLGELKSLKDDLGLDEIKESLSLDKRDFDLRADDDRPAVSAAKDTDTDTGSTTPDAGAGAKVSFSKPGDRAAADDGATGADSAADDADRKPAAAVAGRERPPFDLDAT